MRTDKRFAQKSDKKAASRVHKRGIVGYSKKSALLEEAITHMNTGKYGRSSAALKELLALDPQNIEARRLFATLHLRLGSLVTARQAFESLANEAIGRQDYWLAESLLREYLAAGPRCVPFLEQLAHVYQEKGDEMAAVVELGKAIEVLRDDPDADNPQKPSQLYAKIRELAPASSVALQLAPLFDVQTGEFLARPHDPTDSMSNDSVPNEEFAISPDGSDARTVPEHDLPEVMPWEVPDDPAEQSEPELEAGSQTEPDSEALPEPMPEPEADFCRLSAPVEAQDYATPETPPDSQAAMETSFAPEAVLDSGQAETSFALAESTPTAAPDTESPVSVSELSETPGLSSPMPWEQVADASVQIVESENVAVSVPEAALTLESLLASLKTEETSVAPAVAVVIEEASATASSVDASLDGGQTSASVPEDGRPTESVPMPAPMPWEQISDPAIQIPVPEDAPSRSPEALVDSSSALESSSPSATVLAVATDQTVIGNIEAMAPIAREEPETALRDMPCTPEAAPSAADTASPASFSWNSVFDKAWKFTAETIAPAPAAPEKYNETPSEPAQDQARTDADGISGTWVSAAPSTQTEVPSPDAPAMPAPFATAAEVVSVDVPSTPSIEQNPPAADSAPAQPASHWNTGEVAVQVHRPSKKKKRWEKDDGVVEPTAVPPPDESLTETVLEAIRESQSNVEQPLPRMDGVAAPTDDARPDWMQASAAITFDRAEAPKPRWSDVNVAVQAEGDAARPEAVSAVDVLFSPGSATDEPHPGGQLSWSRPRPRFMARVHRVRIGISTFVGSCFSTTRSLGFLTLMMTIATMVVAAIGLAGVGLIWMAMEDPPSPTYQTLTVSPPRTITDAKKNGYFLLLGFDAPAGQDPVQTGYERRVERAQDRVAADICMGEGGKSPGLAGASEQMVKQWLRSRDPLAQFKGQSATLKSLTSHEATALARYQQWLGMPFDDWGFGQSMSPDCPRVLLAHRLFLLEGFNQDLATGLDRLEADVQAWRTALAHSKTLAMKMLAVTAVQDDVWLASGILSRVDLDGSTLGRLSKMVRPLDQVELSVRWPMQSQFVWSTKTLPLELREDAMHDRPWHASIAAAMRLPVQRRANAYAEYYDAANKAVAGGRYTNLPKVSSFVRTPPSSLMDYLANPVEHIVGIEPLPSWDPYVARMVEADAQLRLAGLQAWLRRGPQDSDVLMRLAKAGQGYYDPFTGLPMLVNQRKGVLYSVGRDGKDQEGDDIRDVTVTIPALTGAEFRRTPASSSFR